MNIKQTYKSPDGKHQLFTLTIKHQSSRSKHKALQELIKHLECPLM